MAQSVDSRNMTHHQISLVEHALRQVFRIEPAEWDELPLDLQASFTRYMCRDAWTGQCDLLSLREAALLVIRDAISGTGEFGDEEQLCGGLPAM
jgi:hypothetical protein